MAAAVLIAASAFFVSAQSVDRQIEAIRMAYADAKAKIAAAKNEPETSSVYFNELRVNSGRASWPSVGIYNSTITFYYEIRGEGPYPDSLFKVNVRTKRSARVETEEFLFDPSGKLIFYVGNDGEVEKRVYFSDGRTIRYLKGRTQVDLSNRAARPEITEIQKSSNSLLSVFRNSNR